MHEEVRLRLKFQQRSSSYFLFTNCNICPIVPNSVFVWTDKPSPVKKEKKHFGRLGLVVYRSSLIGCGHEPIFERLKQWLARWRWSPVKGGLTPPAKYNILLRGKESLSQKPFQCIKLYLFATLPPVCLLVPVNRKNRQADSLLWNFFFDSEKFFFFQNFFFFFFFTCHIIFPLTSKCCDRFQSAIYFPTLCFAKPLQIDLYSWLEGWFSTPV